MGVIVLDCETTGATNDTKGNPFTAANRLCLVGIMVDGRYSEFNIDYDKSPNGESLRQLQREIDGCNLIVGFNLKFDLHWLRRYGITFEHCNLWDCQYVFFISTYHKHRYPALGAVGAEYGFAGKLDTVRVDYWEQGVDTDQVPLPILSEYLRQDVRLTEQVYQHQVKLLNGEFSPLRKSIWIANQDLMVTEEMEWNGLKADLGKMNERAGELRCQIATVDEELNGHVDTAGFNWNSGDHLSAFLYGGVAKIKQREKFNFTYKDGRQVEKERWAIKEHTFPRLIEPLDGTKLAKEGYWSTSTDVLRQLPRSRSVKRILTQLLLRAELEQKVSMYYEGWPSLYHAMGWEDEIIHPNLNHCVAATGRLSSSKPNEQNMDKEFMSCIITRF
jgi:DNA polymerase I-like protein with 3'-5' exonuclease and polymerase domains